MTRGLLISVILIPMFLLMFCGPSQQKPVSNDNAGIANTGPQDKELVPAALLEAVKRDRAKADRKIIELQTKIDALAAKIDKLAIVEPNGTVALTGNVVIDGRLTINGDLQAQNTGARGLGLKNGGDGGIGICFENGGPTIYFYFTKGARRLSMGLDGKYVDTDLFKIP
jgi:hypothetical protein